MIRHGYIFVSPSVNVKRLGSARLAGRNSIGKSSSNSTSSTKRIVSRNSSKIKCQNEIPILKEIIDGENDDVVEDSSIL